MKALKYTPEVQHIEIQLLSEIFGRILQQVLRSASSCRNLNRVFIFEEYHPSVKDELTLGYDTDILSGVLVYINCLSSLYINLPSFS